MVNGRFEWGDGMIKENLKNVLTAVRDMINRSSEIGIRKAQDAEEQAYKAQTTAETAQTTAETAQTIGETAQTIGEIAQSTINQLQTSMSDVLYKKVSFIFDKQTNGRDNFVFNGWKYYKISEFAPNSADIVSFYGTKESGDAASDYVEGTNCYEYGFFIVVTTPGICSLTFETLSGSQITIKFTALSTGLYARFTEGNPTMTAGVGEFIFPFSYSNADVNLQTTVSDFDYIGINSSTAGSTKKFRITVDDSGTLKATEVT